MGLIRKDSDYAIRGLTYLAGAPKGKWISIDKIARKQRVPTIYLRKIFQRLVEARLVNSKRGPDGGYYILRKSQAISFKEILEAVQGRVALSDCIFDDNVCSYSKRCSVKKGLSHIQKKLANLLREYTLSDFLD